MYFERKGSSVRMRTDFIHLEEVKTEGKTEIMKLIFKNLRD